MKTDGSVPTSPGGKRGAIGGCCICRYVGKLTFEHVPPRAAFDDRRVFKAKIHDADDEALAEEVGASVTC